MGTDTVPTVITVHGCPRLDPVSIVALLDAQAANRTAGLVTAQGRLTWADMWNLAGNARDTIVSICGVAGAVGVLMRNTPDAVACLAGGLRAGANVVSLPLPGRGADLAAYVTSLTRMCARTGVAAVLCDQDTSTMLAGSLGRPIVTFGQACTGTAARRQDTDGTLTQFTSGSTGMPTGVPLDAEQLGANVAAIIDHAEFDQGTDFVSWLPLSHDMGLVGMLLCPWALGSTLTLRTPEQFVTNPTIWLDDLAATRARATAVPNFALDIAARAVERGHRPGSLAGLEQLIVGGEPNGADTFRRFERACNPYGLRPSALTPAYGMAEAALAVTMTRRHERWRSVTVDTDALAAGRIECAGTGVELVVCGRPLPGFQVTAGEVLGPTGRVALDGPSVTNAGTVNLAASGELVTSDVGFIGGGELVIVGRTDDVVIVRGLNLWPADIERAAARCSQARAGCVAAVQDSGELTVVAEPAAGHLDLEAAARDIRRYVSRHVGVGPRRVVWVRPGTLPKTSSGKLQRKAITVRLAGGQLAVIADIDWRRTP